VTDGRWCPQCHAALANLRAANERKAAKGQALYAEIRSVVDTYDGPLPMTAKRVLQRLQRQPPPTIRTVQWHLTRLRAERPVLRAAKLNDTQSSVV
jgi:hypothetical protein